MNTLLTISIPTYNRSSNLQLLLDTLIVELNGFENLVEVIVSDNASIDTTSSVLLDFKEKFPSAVIIRNEKNVGPDLNISACFNSATSPYVWIIGDDDLPKTGILKEIIFLLKEHKPHMVYIQSEWVVKIEDSNQGAVNNILSYEKMEREKFAKRVNVWVTFISGIIVNKEYLRTYVDASSTPRYSGTYLVQLEWVLDTLKYGSNFMYIRSPCILATGGNSGGYTPLAVFAVNFPNIIINIFGKESTIYKNILKQSLINYFPGLVWGIRFNNIGDFNFEDVWSKVDDALGSFLYYKFIIKPIGVCPRLVSKVFFVMSRFFSRLNNLIN